MFNEGCAVHTHWKSWVGAGHVVSSRIQGSVHRPLSDVQSKAVLKSFPGSCYGFRDPGEFPPVYQSAALLQVVFKNSLENCCPCFAKSLENVASLLISGSHKSASCWSSLTWNHTG